MVEYLRELRLPAPAKLNLMLRIVGRREDGYHLLQTVFQFVDQSDWIRLRLRNDGVIRLLTPLSGVPEASDLTVRAAQALAAYAGVQAGVEIEIEKNLPMGGGLGGGSSDCATTLLGLVRLWGLQIPENELIQLGLKLGADVPVFLFGRSAWAEGVGEKLTELELPESWYVVVVPACQVSTGMIFGAEELTRDNLPIKIADFTAGQQDNHCQPVVMAKYPEVTAAMNDLSRYAKPRLTGTGACVFAEFQSEQAARLAADGLKSRWDLFVGRGMNVSPLHRALDLA